MPCHETGLVGFRVSGAVVGEKLAMWWLALVDVTFDRLAYSFTIVSEAKESLQFVASVICASMSWGGVVGSF